MIYVKEKKKHIILNILNFFIPYQRHYFVFCFLSAFLQFPTCVCFNIALICQTLTDGSSKSKDYIVLV